MLNKEYISAIYYTKNTNKIHFKNYFSFIFQTLHHTQTRALVSSPRPHTKYVDLYANAKMRSLQALYNRKAILKVRSFYAILRTSTQKYCLSVKIIIL